MTKPIYPDPPIASKFNKPSSYAFYMQKTPTENYIEVTPDRFVSLNLAPQSVSVREPFATSIQFTQGGGKIRESRGGLIKPISISGTTGFAPLPTGRSLHVGSLIPGSITTTTQNPKLLVPKLKEPLDTILAARSGYLAFHKLRYLFRLYAHELSVGNTQVTLHYIDTKNDEYWRIEPQEFVMQRSSRKPFSYDYNIAFQAIEESSFRPPTNYVDDPGSGIKQTLGYLGRAAPDTGVMAFIIRMAEKGTSGLNYLKHLSGVVQRKMQEACRGINAVVGYFENIHSTALIVADTLNVLLAQLDNTIAGLFNTTALLTEDGALVVNFLEVNEWALELQTLKDYVQAYASSIKPHNQDAINRINGAFSQGRLKQGSTTDLLKDAPGSVGSLDANPFIGQSGLQLVTNMQQLASVRSMRAVMINQGDTIQSLALRLLGDIQRFVDLVLINNLKAPYIVADKANKPSNTLAWGDYINVPATSTGTDIGDSDPQLAPSFMRVVTRTSIPTEVIDEGLTTAWLIDQWIGYTVTITHAGVDYTRVVVGNTGDTLTVNSSWDLLPAVGDAYALNMDTFDIHRPVTPEVRAFGADLLLAFRPQTGSNQNPLADIVISPSGDFAFVRGVENMIQALMLRLNTEQGRHPFHPDFGIQAPIGQAWNEDAQFLYTFFIRKSMLLDPRVEQVRNARLELHASTLNFIADVQPIQVRNSRQITVGVG